MNYSNRGFGLNIPKITKNILILNIVLFLLTQIGIATNRYDLTHYLAIYHPLSENFRPFQLITYMFMHGSFGHIFFNMFALVMFGKILENVWGEKKFFIYYLVTGVGAALFSIGVTYLRYYILKSQVPENVLNNILLNGRELLENQKNFANPVYGKLNLLVNYTANIPTVGASGAIFGILMAFGMMFPDAQLMLLFPPIPIKGKYIAIVALVLGVMMDFRGNVAHFAHLGGMVFGYILIKYWRKNTTNFY